MKLNLKLLIGIITLLVGNGFVYAAEQNEDFESYYEKKSRQFVSANPFGSFMRESFISGLIKGLKPKWYAEWKMENTKNPEEYAFMALASDYSKNINKHEFDEAIEKLIKNNADINNILYWVTNQTLLMKILQVITELDYFLSRDKKNLQEMSSLSDPTNSYGGIKINTQDRISKKKQQIKKLKDTITQLLPYVNDFDIKDGLGITVFDYAKNDEEMTKLLVDAKLALEERKKKIREHLQEGLPVKDLQDIVLGY